MIRFAAAGDVRFSGAALPPSCSGRYIHYPVQVPRSSGASIEHVWDPSYKAVPQFYIDLSFGRRRRHWRLGGMASAPAAAAVIHEQVPHGSYSLEIRCF